MSTTSRKTYARRQKQLREGVERQKQMYEYLEGPYYRRTVDKNGDESFFLGWLVWDAVWKWRNWFRKTFNWRK